MRTSLNQGNAISKECKESSFGLACLRYLGVGCEVCGVAVIVIATLLVVIWGLMFVLK